jgi:ComF family protein
MLKPLLDFFFPRACIGCGCWENSYLCPDCLNFLKTQNELICPYCFKPGIGGQTHFSCRRKWGLDGLTAIFEYKGIVEQITQQLKYDFNTDLGETILEMVLSFCGENKAFTKFVSQKSVSLVPVPLHWLRFNWRGFNQAELLGRMIADKLGVRFLPDLLIRKKYTRPQTKFKKKERIKNICHAFIFNQEFDPQERIIVFDDVWTTGATIRECSQVLKRNGVKKVWALTLAR